MLSRRPVSLSLKVSDLDHRERLCIQCPVCRGEIGRQCYDLSLELPPDYLVIRYVTRHFCRRCSSGREKVRPQGWIQDWPRSTGES